VIEFREPQAHNRPDDPELYQPLAHVRVTVAGAQEFRETTTNPEGRFEFAGLPRGQYRVAIYVKPPKRVLPHGTSFHQAHSDPAAVMVEDCPARVSFTVSEWTELISNLAPLPEAHACEGASAWPSLPSQAAVTIRFENGRVSPVRLYWLDFGGNRVFYQTIPPGQAVYQPTYESHRWIVTRRPTNASRCTSPPGSARSRKSASLRFSVHLPAAAVRDRMRRQDAPVAHLVGKLRHRALDLPPQTADQGIQAPRLGHVNRHVRADAAAPHLEVA
jgi:von Hippel-Lindau disease tumor supressor